MVGFEKYRIIKPLGDGKKRKFASVFLCESKLDGKTCVLKHIQKNNLNGVVQERLISESNFNFSTKGLPRTLDFIETETELILFRTFQEGEPMHLFLKRIKKSERIKMLIQIMRKVEILLNELHSKSIYHLDLKPSNILIDQVEEELVVSIIDFGLALRKPIVETRKILFPLGFAAPELVLNDLEIIDHRTDYFSIGVSCWYALNGEIPLLHPNPSITTNLQLTHPLPELTGVYRGVNNAIQKMTAKYKFQIPPNKMDKQLLKSCLLEGMNERYDNFSEFIDDLKDGMIQKKKWLIF